MTMTTLPDARRNLLWTEAEDARLLEMRGAKLPAPQIAAALGRPVGAVYVRARKLSSRVMDRAVWTPKEDAHLVAMVREGRLVDAEIAEAMDRSYASVRWRIKALDLKGARPPKAVAPRAEPDRPKRARRAPASGMSTWKPEELERLAALAEGGAVSIAEAADDIGRPIAGVRAKARELDLSFPDPQKRRLEEENAKIKAAWAERADLDHVAAATGLSLRRLRKRAADLGLREARRRIRPEDQAGIEEIRVFAATMTITEAAVKAGRDVRTLRKIAEAEGIVFRSGASRTGMTVSRPKIAKPAATKVARERTISAKTRKPAAVTKIKPAAPQRAPIFDPDRLRRSEALIDIGLPETPKAAPPADRLAMIRAVAAKMRSEGRLQP
jgi:transposase-like protein